MFEGLRRLSLHHLQTPVCATCPLLLSAPFRNEPHSVFMPLRLMADIPCTCVPYAHAEAAGEQGSREGQLPGPCPQESCSSRPKTSPELLSQWQALNPNHPFSPKFRHIPKNLKPCSPQMPQPGPMNSSLGRKDPQSAPLPSLIRSPPGGRRGGCPSGGWGLEALRVDG